MKRTVYDGKLFDVTVEELPVVDGALHPTSSRAQRPAA